MRRLPTLALLLLAPFILLARDAAVAEGPFDGAYIVAEKLPDARRYYVFQQHGDQIGLVVLTPSGQWFYGLGTVSGDTATGPVVSSQSNEPTGKFSVTLSVNGTLSGMKTWEQQGAGPSQSLLLSGERFSWWDRERLCKELVEVRERFGFKRQDIASMRQGAEPGIVCEAYP